MKYEKFGYWIMNDVVKPLMDEREKAHTSGETMNELTDKSQDTPSDEPDIEITTDDPKIKARLDQLSQAKKVKGKCVMTIQFKNHGEYLMWKKYFGNGRQWEFLVGYPANMRAEFTFSNSLEVEMIAKKIVQLLEAGFDVYSSMWELDKNEETEETQINEEEEKCRM